MSKQFEDLLTMYLVARDYVETENRKYGPFEEKPTLDMAINELREARRELLEYVAELESERRWKDSNVELPTEDTDGNTLLVIYRHSGEWARAPFGIEFSDEFVRHYSHWMYAPELPEVER